MTHPATTEQAAKRPALDPSARFVFLVPDQDHRERVRYVTSDIFDVVDNFMPAAIEATPGAFAGRNVVLAYDVQACGANKNFASWRGAVVEVLAPLVLSLFELDIPTGEKFTADDVAAWPGRWRRLETSALGALSEMKANQAKVSAAAAEDESERAKRAKYHASIVSGLTAYLEEIDVAADALDGWRNRKTWEITSDGSDQFLVAWMDGFRAKGGHVTRTYAADTLSAISRRDRQARRDKVCRGLGLLPHTPDGELELHRWCAAMVQDGVADGDGLTPVELAYVAMRHWVWLCKRSAMRMRGEHHVMPVFVGPQGSGKTVSCERLCSVWSELDMPIDASFLCDNKRAPILSKAITGRWEEMTGAQKSDIEALKQVITAPTINYRPMRTNDCEVLPRSMSFLGTSNHGVAIMVADTTGARRFVEMHTPDRCNWDIINDIDVRLCWQAVAVDDPPPIAEHLGLIRDHQSGLVHRDPVSMWLDEDDLTYTIKTKLSDSMFEETLPAYDPQTGIAFEDLACRFRSWCCKVGQAPIGAKMLAGRLTQEAWVNKQVRVGGKLKRRMFRQVDWQAREDARKAGGCQDGQP